MILLLILTANNLGNEQHVQGAYLKRDLEAVQGVEVLL
jgi:hypothetical protein